MKLKRIATMLVAAVLILLFMASALAESAVITQNTRVYKEASTSSESMKVSKGTQVELLATKGDWALVEKNSVRAFVKAKYVAVNTVHGALIKEGVPAIITANTRVYKKPSTSSVSLRVSEGMKVNLVSADSDWALVENNGVYAYMKSKYVEAIQFTQPAYNPQPAVITADTRVYKKASTASASLRVNKGMQVNLLATNGGWAMVENNGTRAYMNKEYVELCSEVEQPVVTPEPTVAPTPIPTATPAPAVGNYFESDKYSNEEKCFLFLTKEMGLNTAAACGILANIRKESNFTPDIGTSYYGLVQWGGGRKTNLQSFCSKNGYSHSSLEGQLNFLEHELKNSYTSVLEYLESVPNTAKGAYDAAYHFCYYYERPSNKASKSASRGELARDTYFVKYA